MKKRILSLLLAALMLTQFTACSEKTTGEDTSGGEDTSAVPGEETSESESETNEYDALMADVPTGNYDGYQFMMLNNESNFAYTQMDADEQTGEPIHDAIYNRNQAVANRLNIKIDENMVGYADVTTTMTNCIASEDDTYSCFWNEAYLIAPFAIGGQLLNINDISAIDLEKPWWDGDALDEIAFGDYQYFLVGDLHLMFKEAFFIMGFNKNILDANNLAEPYDMVREGTWTMDVMKSYMETVKVDLNGDGVMDGYDRFGMTTTGSCVAGFIIASDEVFIERGEDGIPVLVQPSDRFYSVYEKIFGMTMDTSVDYSCIAGVTPNLSVYEDDFHGVFRSGNALFYLEPIGSLKKFRDIEIEFGVLPTPKYDESQEDYITYITSFAALCGIPITADAERTGVILENLGAESFGELRETYINDTLNFKYIRDEESVEMLNLILDSGRFNLADILSIGDPMNVIISSLLMRQIELASSYASIQEATANQLAENVNKLMKVEQ